jgi:hypothetical protein
LHLTATNFGARATISHNKELSSGRNNKVARIKVSKYPVKDTDVIRGDKVTEENVQTVKDMDSALAYKRLIT